MDKEYELPFQWNRVQQLTTTNSCSSRGSNSFFCTPWEPALTCTYTHTRQMTRNLRLDSPENYDTKKINKMIDSSRYSYIFIDQCLQSLSQRLPTAADGGICKDPQPNIGHKENPNWSYPLSPSLWNSVNHKEEGEEEL